jgi:hypothetical protein
MAKVANAQMTTEGVAGADFDATTSATLFKQQFEKAPPITKGTELLFTWDPSTDTLLTFRDGLQMGYIQSPLLCHALFGSFLSKDCLSQRARFNMTRGLRRQLPLTFRNGGLPPA